jgi:aminoglycoside phosphotransferase
VTTTSPDSSIPAAVRGLAGAGPIRRVWTNELGGSTFQLGLGAGRRFAKWTPMSSGIDLSGEASRLTWAADHATVARLLDAGADGEGSWILTAGLPGQNAVSDRWRGEPATAVAVLGTGLRALHDRLPVATCPFTWSATERLGHIRDRPTASQLDPSRWHAEHRTHSVASALDLLADTPDVDVEVVCHGDACGPNTVIADDGRLSGHVDLGDLGVADRWADLAVATWSTRWNYGPGWEAALLDAYGVEPDPERIAYYRLLWDLDPGRRPASRP